MTTEHSPNATKLQQAIAQLGSYYGIVTSSQFMAILLGLAKDGKQNKDGSTSGFGTGQDTQLAATIISAANQKVSNPIEQLISGLMGITDGGVYMREFCERVDSFIQKPDGVQEVDNEALIKKITGEQSNGSRLFTVTYQDKSRKYGSVNSMSEIIGGGATVVI